MRGADLYRVFEAILPYKVLRTIVESAKFQERETKLGALRLLRTMVVAAAAGSWYAVSSQAGAGRSC